MKNRRVFEFRLGKLGLGLFVGGMSLLLFSLFLIGVVVGRHMEAYPERYATGILEMIGSRLSAALPQGEKVVSPESETAGKEEAPVGEGEVVPAGSDTPVEKKGMAAPENPPEAVKEKGAQGEKGQGPLEKGPAQAGVSSAGRSGEAARPATVVGVEGASKKMASSPQGRPVEEGSAQKGRVTEPKAAATIPQNGRYEVQAAAYRERAQAGKLVKKFEGFGYSSQVVLKEIPGKGQWFRVIVGGFESREKAQEAAEQLTAKVSGLKCVIRSSPKNADGG